MPRITVQLAEGGPITEMDTVELIRTDGGFENEDEITRWVEYRLPSDPNGRAVHRSVHVHLKKAVVFGQAAIASF